ncbi:MAG TPA: hypothetical protein VF316_06670 [Polyangiaceae bacterium]
MRARRPLVVVLMGSLLAAMGAEAAQADSPTPAPILVTLQGRGPVRVVVAEGNVLPCISTDNRKLWDGRFEPGGTLNLSTFQECVCVQQTISPSVELDWGPSRLHCRPQICIGYGLSRICHPAADPTIRVELWSTQP